MGRSIATRPTGTVSDHGTRRPPDGRRGWNTTVKCQNAHGRPTFAIVCRLPPSGATKHTPVPPDRHRFGPRRTKATRRAPFVVYRRVVPRSALPTRRAQRRAKMHTGQPTGSVCRLPPYSATDCTCHPMGTTTSQDAQRPTDGRRAPSTNLPRWDERRPPTRKATQSGSTHTRDPTRRRSPP